jgi:3-oxoacyl-[acyl-carrier protein] reductase
MANDLISLKDKVTLITGGSRGIGRACAVMAAQAGSTVAINYLNNSAAAEVTIEACESHGAQARAFQADIADLIQVEQMVQDVIDVFGRIDVLVNNAGIWVHNPIDKMTAKQLKETIDTNLYGTFYPIMAVAPHMKRRRSGSIINISSTAGQRGEAYHSPYAATKGAVIALTKSLAPELADFNISMTIPTIQS